MYKPCPKCPCGKMTGPTYVKTMTGEALRYSCSTCGYSSDEPCKRASDPGHLPQPWPAPFRRLTTPIDGQFLVPAPHVDPRWKASRVTGSAIVGDH